MMDLKGGVFLDRDGTIIEEKGYLSDPEGVELIPGAARAIRLFNHLGLRTAVVSNQSGVARGYFPISIVEEINARVKSLLGEGGPLLTGCTTVLTTRMTGAPVASQGQVCYSWLQRNWV
jgi:D-glycero-D-manno-heptose 1,7-bisphosphate phosphatase